MSYSKQTWVDGVNGNTPINAARLNNMEDGIAAANAAIPFLNGVQNAAGLKVVTGIINAVFSNISYAIPTPTWTGFTAAPVVVAVPSSGNTYATYCEIDSVTATGCWIVVRSAGANLTATIPVHYIAIGI
jgi:hypothetical protein